MLIVRLLGGLAVSVDGDDVPAPRGRCAALLGWLALHPGMQPRSRVAARLWPDVMDESARRSLRTALLDLRSALGPAAAEHLRGTRDEIGLGPEVRVDYREFTLAAADGRLAHALAVGTAGELLPELDHDWVFEAREEHRLRVAAVIEQLAQEAERRGDLATAAEHTRDLVALDPLSEDHARALMRRLAEADDRAAALAAFEQHRDRLRTELRMAPSAATRALADEIRGDEPPRPEAAPRSLPGPLLLAATGPLVGRADALAELADAWDAAAAGGPLLCLVTGDAGVGKSRLIGELAREVADGGAAVLYGACREGAQPSYAPFVDAISLDLRGLAPEEAARRTGTRARDLARVVPDLRDRFGAAADRVTGDSPEGEQLRLFGAVSEYLEHAAQPRALLVLEDIHWASTGTLAMLSHVLRATAAPLLLVVSSRDSPPDLTGSLSSFLSGLERHPATRRIALRGLRAADVETLLRATAPRPALDVSRTARLLHEATGGSPLFLREIVRELPAEGVLHTVPISPSVRDHVAGRFALLTEGDGELLDAAAVLGADFEARVCGLVLDRPLPEVLDALDRAAGLGLVVAVPGAAGRFQFTHAVLREVRYESIPAGRRMQLHHAAGGVLRVSGAPVTELARHFAAAADLGDRADAFDYARRAGESARERFAFADAAVHFEQAIGLAASLPAVGERELLELAIQRGEALHRAGDPAHREVLLGAAAAARGIGDADLLTRAALALSEQGWTTSSVGSQEAIVEVAREALGGLPVSAAADRARLMAMIAATIHLADDHVAGRRIATEALEQARESGDLDVLGEVLISAHWACFDPLNLEQRLAWASEACELAERINNPVVAAQAFRMLGQDRLEGADLRGARAALDRADSIAEALDSPFLRAFSLGNNASLAVLAGRLDEAWRLVGDCAALSRRIGIDAIAFFGGAAGAVVIERGQWERGAERGAALVAHGRGIAAQRASLAMFHARLGAREAAARELARFTDDDFGALPRNIQWAPGMVMLADAVTWLRDAEAAARIRALLAPVSGRTAWHAFTALWPIDVSLAQLCVVLGDHAGAHAHLDAAERLCHEHGLVAHRARVALYRLWARRDAGEHADASEALAAAAASPCPGVAREAELMGLAR